MGWINRLKLNLLPTIKNEDSKHSDITIIDAIRKIIVQLGGLTPSEEGVVLNPKKAAKIQERLELYSDAEIREKFSKQLLSLAQADAYMIDDEIKRKDMGYIVKWKELGMVLVKYELWVGWWQPTEFIMRTGSTSWIAYDIPIWAVTMRC